MYVQNKIGLEAEFLLRSKKGELLFPARDGFSTDEFCILGELRAEPGKTVGETVGNFYAELANVISRAENRGLVVDFSGMTEVPAEFYFEILRHSGLKSIPPCENVYKTDILSFSDTVTKNGKIVSARISAGLHVHFSQKVVHEWITGKNGRNSAEHNILTKTQIQSIVRKMDKNVLPYYPMKKPLKYRQPGFYEIKPWGFEYRSLPMTNAFTNLSDVLWLVDTAFSYLEELKK